MAARKHVFHFLPSSTIVGGGGETNGDEFEESDVVWGCHVEESVRTKPIRSNRRKNSEKVDRVTAPASLPVNIPDWSKILKHECDSNSYNSNCGDEEEDEVTGVVIPPHELLWRNRAASFSVHEGLGRTLKGRDLSRVRNAIFEKTGFQD